MNHSVHLKRFGCHLRPVYLDDAEFIVNLRNQEFAKGTIHETSGDICKQMKWIEEYFKRPNDYYWIICIDDGNDTPIGTTGLYDFTVDGREAMPGRWAMYPQNRVNVMAPVFLVYQYAFETLGVERLVMDVVADNKKVCRFHQLLGVDRIMEPDRYRGTDTEVGKHMVWYELCHNQWDTFKKRWQPILEAF